MPSAKKDVLERYYKLWIDGKTASQIRKSLKLKKKEFEKLLPDFVTFCRHSVQFEPRDRLTKETKGIKKIPLTDDIREKFITYVASGLSFDKAALMLDIPLPTVFNFWFLEYPAFKIQCDDAVRFTNAEAYQALYKRVRGYDLDCEIITKSEGTNKDGDAYSNETTVTKVNHIKPSVNAIKFYLFNRDPDNWTIDGMRTGKGKKGKILDFIEGQAEDVPAEDMKNYDKEQAAHDDLHNKEN